MSDRRTDRLQIISLIGFVLLSAWNVFDARSAPARYLSAATVAFCAAGAAWKILRYRERYHTAR